MSVDDKRYNYTVTQFCMSDPWREKDRMEPQTEVGGGIITPNSKAGQRIVRDTHQP